MHDLLSLATCGSETSERFRLSNDICLDASSAKANINLTEVDRAEYNIPRGFIFHDASKLSLHLAAQQQEPPAMRIL
jgi:hypothetical protein